MTESKCFVIAGSPTAQQWWREKLVGAGIVDALLALEEHRVFVSPLSLGHRLSTASWLAIEAASLSPKLSAACADAVAEAAARCVLEFAERDASGKEHAGGRRAHALPGEAVEAIAVAAGEAIASGLAVSGYAPCK